MTPWWSESCGGWVGGAIGLVGGLFGTLCGILGMKGRPLTILFKGAIFLGGGALFAGIVAVLWGQPYHVWYPLVLSGALASGIPAYLLPAERLRQREMERVRLGAEELRRGL